MIGMMSAAVIAGRFSKSANWIPMPQGRAAVRLYGG